MKLLNNTIVDNNSLSFDKYDGYNSKIASILFLNIDRKPEKKLFISL